MKLLGVSICAEIGHGYVMGASTVVVALAGVGSFLTAVVVGVFLVVGNRAHESWQSVMDSCPRKRFSPRLESTFHGCPSAT